MAVKSKYRAQPTYVDGKRFASKAEARRYSELVLLERGGVISNLETQRAFELKVNGVLICRYLADFVYFENGKRMVEDTKGVRTPVYAIKRKLMRALYDIDILETR